MTDPKRRSDVLQRSFPETNAGGYTRRDGTIEFYGRINAMLSKTDTVLDFGAGRGAFVDDPVLARRDLALLKGRVARVVGADIDPVVLGNPSLDEAIQISDSTPYPFATHEFDFIVSDYAFEHLSDPITVAREFNRILRPGGWVCARTPYRWGSIGLFTNLIPNRLHVSLLARIQPARRPEDVFPTRYRLNTRTALRAAFPGWSDCSYFYTPEPAYLATSTSLMKFGRTIDALLPGPVLLVFMRKPA
jgi:SAM-dependent methyltransferase